MKNFLNFILFREWNDRISRMVGYRFLVIVFWLLMVVAALAICGIFNAL